MPDPSLSAAIREAYASAPTGTVIHHTLEFWHPAFTSPIRVVRDFEPLDARIEAGAARDAGQIVTFVPYAFDVVPPDQTSAALPQCTIEIDNVSREIVGALGAAVRAGGPIEVIYRPYLSDTADEGPDTDPPLILTLISVSADAHRIRAVAGFPDLRNRLFPFLDYSLERFPGLVA